MESNVRRYLLYALGEILLVVIGILVALQVNNWNQERLEMRVERQLLEQLTRDLKGSLGDLNYNIKIHDKGQRSAEFLLDYMEKDYPYHDSLASHFASSFPWTRLVINLGAYETIKSHGIEIISNVELRDQIIDLFEGRLYFLRQLENLVQDYSENMRRAESVRFFRSSHVDFMVKNALDFGKSVPRDYGQLKKDEDFRYHLESFLHLMKVLQNVGNIPFQRGIKNLIDAIEQELGTN